MVSLYAGVDAVRAYVSEQAARGRDHVRKLVRADRDRMLELVDGLTAEQAGASPSADEYSVLQVLQHLDSGFERSVRRIAALSRGEPFTPPPTPPSAGGIPDAGPATFAEAHERFREGTTAVLDTLAQAEPGSNLHGTVDHAQFGPFNWLEWATYSHHVHTQDYIGQVERLVEEFRAPR